ncbi:MAG: PadR family transcriptional regulator [Candidatus Promineifilaceae bacterium]
MTADPAKFLPLTTAEFQILLSLAGSERHGYAIMQDVEAATGGKVNLRPGTLYRSIKKLLDAGLIEETEDRPDPALDDERRRYYQLTGLGRRTAVAEANRLNALVSQAYSRLGLSKKARGEI